MRKLATLIPVLALLLTGCGSHNHNAVGPEPDPWATLEEAYVYAFPLELMDATMKSATNTEEVIPGKAPVNQFMHGQNTVTATFTTVVTPNVDTIYTQVWLDLGEEPIIYTMPKADRFFNVQLLDAWTNTVKVLTEPGDYAFVKKDWDGKLPAGVEKVEFPTQMNWFIARCLLKGNDDLQKVQEIQGNMVIRPLSAYGKEKEYTPEKGTYSKENDYVPINKVLSLTPEQFFNSVNKLMENNPPADEDAEKLEKIAKVNVGPGKEFKTDVLTGNVPTQWKQMLQNIRQKVISDGQKYIVEMGKWSYFGRPIGEFRTEYNYRTMIALGGLGANTLDVAMYCKTSADEKMNGANSYNVHFKSLPPILENSNGFWSVTAYGDDDFLIDNPLNRYCINDRSKFKKNEDGSLDIRVSAEEPTDIDNANWLPVAKDKGFHLYMRIYTPDMAKIETWEAPTIEVIK